MDPVSSIIMRESKVKFLCAYMKKRAVHEGVEWALTEGYLQHYFDRGTRCFFGVELDNEGRLLRDEQQAAFFQSYSRELDPFDIVGGPMNRKKKKAKSQQPRKTPEQLRDEKVMRLAHHILTKTIEPANLNLEEVIDVLTIVAKGIVLSTTSDEDLEARSEMIGWIQGSFVTGLDVIDPLADLPRAWIVPPQGLITEPVGILWSGSHDDDEGEDAGDGVQVMLGAELETFRAEIAEDPADVIVIEGVEGLAVTDPCWDGEDTVTCENPQCGKVHDVHLRVAENLFQQAVERRRHETAPN